MKDYSLHFNELHTINACLAARDSLANSDEIQTLKNQLNSATSEDKKTLGKELNILRTSLFSACDSRIKIIQEEQEKDTFTDFDETFYSTSFQNTTAGRLHPITLVMDEIVQIFQKMGFDVADGPLVETQQLCFTELNMPDYHPARSMQDTFYLNQKDKAGENLIMRTHTSGIQLRYGKSHQPPIRIVAPGQVYRNENIDATHDIMFHQIECLVVDKNVTISHLKTVLQRLFSLVFKDETLKIRFRTSYFPYTIPSMEYDISCPFCKQAGCRVCKYNKWIEIGGAGLVHPDVIKNFGVDASEYQGFAFGFGVDRVAQFKLGVSGIGQFFTGSMKFLNRN
jgi:phenylalanyl-tRNA synthetase alpha chain